MGRSRIPAFVAFALATATFVAVSDASDFVSLLLLLVFLFWHVLLLLLLLLDAGCTSARNKKQQNTHFANTLEPLNEEHRTISNFM